MVLESQLPGVRGESIASPEKQQGPCRWVLELMFPKLAWPPAPASKKPHPHQVVLGPFAQGGGGSHLERSSKHPRSSCSPDSCNQNRTMRGDKPFFRSSSGVILTTWVLLSYLGAEY